MTSLKPSFSFRWHADQRLSSLLIVFAIGSGFILVFVLAFLIREVWPVLSHGTWFNFLFDKSWYPTEHQYGLAPMLRATLVAAFSAVLLAVPIGLASAIFMQFYAPPFIAKMYRGILALLAGIPSVVYGLWGLTVLVPLIGRWQPPGASLLAAISILAMMIAPTVALTSASALNAVPRALLQGAAALGMTRKGMIVGVAVPSAGVGILGGIFLAIVRAMGETMAVLMVAGNVVQNPSSLFDPIRVLTANIALEMAYATGEHRAALFMSGLILALMVLMLAWTGSRVTLKTYHA